MADPLTQIVTHAVQLAAEAKGTTTDPDAVAEYLAGPSSATTKAAAAVEAIHRFEGGEPSDNCRWCHLLTDVLIDSI